MTQRNRTLRTTLLLLGCSFSILACEVGSCNDSNLSLGKVEDRDAHAWCDFLIFDECIEHTDFVNEDGFIERRCMGQAPVRKGCGNNNIGCKICYDSSKYDDDPGVAAEDACVDFCKQANLSPIGSACGDITSVNPNVGEQNRLAALHSCVNTGGIESKTQSFRRTADANVYELTITNDTSVSVDIANGKATGEATATLGYASIVEDMGQIHLTELIMAVTDIEIKGERFNKGQLELLEPVEISEGSFTVPAGTPVAIRGYDTSGNLVTPIYKVGSNLTGYFNPANDHFELNGTLLSSTTEASIVIGLDVAATFRDQDGDGTPDHRDNCPRVSNSGQVSSHGAPYGDACRGKGILDMNFADGWSSSSWLTNSVGVDGGTGLLVGGTGYVQLETGLMTTAEVLQVADGMGGDVYMEVALKVPSDMPNPYWVGALQAYVEAPSAGVYNAYAGQVELTDFPVGSFWPARFQLPQHIVEMLAGDYGDVKLKFALNINQGAELFTLDNVRFHQGVIPVPVVETAFACPPLVAGEPSGCDAALVLNFEGEDWSTSNGSITRISESNSGFTALKYAGGGYSEIISRELGTAELLKILPESGPAWLHLDVMPGLEQPNAYWKGAVQLLISIPDQSVYNAFLGQVELTPLQNGVYSNLVLPVPDSLLNTLRNVAYFDATFKIIVNVPNDAPPVVLDNLRF